MHSQVGAHMNSDDLKIFLAVRHAGSIKGGARMLKLEHSTVSRRLASLEEELGTRLFERTPEGLLPTEAANTIIPLAERIDLLFAELKDAANATSEAPSGPIRIAVSPVVADHFLIPRFADLQERFPGVRFDITADISRVNVTRREADIAIRQHPSGKSPAEPSALAVKVGQMGFAAFASPAYLARNGRPGRPVCSLAGHRLISTGTWAPGDAWSAQLDEPASLALSVYPFSVAKAAALAGLGIAVLPCLGSDADPGLERVSEVISTMDMWVVTNPDVRNNPVVRAVKEHLIATLRAASAALSGADAAPPIAS